MRLGRCSSLLCTGFCKQAKPDRSFSAEPGSPSVPITMAASSVADQSLHSESKIQWQDIDAGKLQAFRQVLRRLSRQEWKLDASMCLQHYDNFHLQAKEWSCCWCKDAERQSSVHAHCESLLPCKYSQTSVVFQQYLTITWHDNKCTCEQQ